MATLRINWGGSSDAQVAATDGAFAALLSNGSLATWGANLLGGDSNWVAVKELELSYHNGYI